MCFSARSESCGDLFVVLNIYNWLTSRRQVHGRLFASLAHLHNRSNQWRQSSEAIEAHASQGSESNGSVAQFNRLSPSQQQDLINFRRSL